MAFDERDRNFEKALARHLRPVADSETSANPHGREQSADAKCPDAEILAAYHERSLSQEELLSWKSHIAGCAHCQELLADLELTDAIPLDATVERVSDSVLALAAQQEAAMPQGARRAVAAIPASSPKVQSFPAKRYSVLRWIAPAGAIAAGLVVWIALRENKLAPQQTAERVEMAAKMEPAAPAPTSKLAEPLAEDKKRDQAGRPSPKPVLQGPAEKDLFAKAAPSPSLHLQGRNIQQAPSVQNLQGTVGGAISANQNNMALDSSSNTRAVPKADSDQVAGMQQNIGTQSNGARVATQSLPPAPPPAAQTQVAVSAAPAAQNQNADLANATTQNQAAAATESRAYSAAPSLKKVRTAGLVGDSRLAFTPGGKVLWHVGLEGLIERSLDRGKTFTRVDGGVKTDLLAVYAPDDSVCWVVGRSGTILLTLDGGAHWRTLISPIQESIASVRAVDGLHATIGDAANLVRFATTDGGTTWTRVPNE
jgi:hypothetical protein